MSHHNKAKGNGWWKEQLQPLYHLYHSTFLPQASSKHPKQTVLQDTATAARSGADCTSLPWHFKIFPTSNNEFRLFQTIFTVVNETSQGQHLHVTFWPRSCKLFWLSASEGCCIWDGRTGSVEARRGIFPLFCNMSSLLAICSLP